VLLIATPHADGSIAGRRWEQRRMLMGAPPCATDSNNACRWEQRCHTPCSTENAKSGKSIGVRRCAATRYCTEWNGRPWPEMAESWRRAAMEEAKQPKVGRSDLGG
jgi:hypothetical protein